MRKGSYITKKAETLDSFPEIGRIVPEIDDPDIREVFVYSYRLVYQKTSAGVDILALLHSKRDFASSF
jgi:toxin ParE1/3/4